MSRVYYNEHDPHAARWLRNLVARNAIAPGDVDERSIEDVIPSDLAGYAQCHFFAGIGVWSYALRRAGWPDSRPVWTGSCPCQPFSTAGKRGGLADERHLWPAWHWLIHQCRPETIFGEQVASKDGLAWLDLVCADLEGTGYAGWAGDLCAAGVGAPQIRQRLFFVAQNVEDTGRGAAGHIAAVKWREYDQPQPFLAANSGRWRLADRLGDDHQDGVVASAGCVRHEGVFRRGDSEIPKRRQDRRPQRGFECCEPFSSMARATEQGWSEWPQRPAGADWGPAEELGRLRDAERMASPEGERLQRRPDDGDEGRRQRASRQGCEAGELAGAERAGLEGHARHGDDRGQPGRLDAVQAGSASETGGACRPGPTNGFWRDADWIGCTDGKWRPVVASHVKVADGVAADLGRVRSDQESVPLVDKSAFHVGSGSAYEGKSRAKMLKGYGNAIVAEQAAEFIIATMECLP